MRPSVDQYFMSLVDVVSSRGSCIRRKVGCILVNSRNQVLATGYNGPPSGLPNCVDEPCSGAECKSGEGLDKCQAVHAEQNALLQCHNVYEIDTAYCSCAPCIHCVKLLMNTSCKRIVFLNDYPHTDSKKLWCSINRQWEKFEHELANT